MKLSLVKSKPAVRLTPEERQRVRELVEDEGFTRAHAIALVRAGAE